MRGKRLFDRCGFNLPSNNPKKSANFLTLSKYEEWVYNSEFSDWVNPETEKVLSGYSLPTELNTLLNNNLDVVNQ